jgi:hypothetical protein
MFQEKLCVLTQLEEVVEAEAARNGGRSWRRIVWAGFVATLLALSISAFAGFDGLSSTGRHHRRWEISLLSSTDLPDDVQSCIKACVHVNLMVASSGHNTYPQASCDSCSQLQPVDEGRTSKPDSRKLRLVDDLWRHVHRHELCKAVADDDELYNRCTGTNIWRKPWETNSRADGGDEGRGLASGNARDVISRWAAGSSPLRQCIASSQDFEDAQACMDKDQEDENHDARPQSSHHDRSETFSPKQMPQKFKDISAYAKDVSDECRGLESNKVLLRDCLEVEDGMRRALKPIDGDRWSRSLESPHSQEWREPSSKGRHAGYEDAKAAARYAERQVGHHEHFIRRDEQPLRPIPHTFTNGMGAHTGFSQRGREANPMFKFNTPLRTYPSSAPSSSPIATTVQNRMPGIPPLKKIQAQPSPMQASPPSSHQTVSAASSPSPLDSATAKAIATLTESVAKLQRAIQSGQNMQWNATMNQAPIITVSPIIKVSPIISVNLSSGPPQHDMSSSFTSRQFEEDRLSTQHDASQNALLSLLNKTISFLESERREDSRRQPNLDVNDSMSRLEKRVSDIEGKVDNSASSSETKSSKKPTEDEPNDSHESSRHEVTGENTPATAPNGGVAAAPATAPNGNVATAPNGGVAAAPATAPNGNVATAPNGNVATAPNGGVAAAPATAPNGNVATAPNGDVAPHAAAGETVPSESAHDSASHSAVGEHNEARSDAEHEAASKNVPTESQNDVQHGGAGETVQNEAHSNSEASHAPADDVQAAGAKEDNTIHRVMPSDVATPLIEPPGGVFKDPVIVKLSYTPGEMVYYTTDGAVPSENSTLYTGPFALLAGSNTRVGAVALRSSDATYSNVAWGSFEVQPCVMHDRKCCHWQEVLVRFDALRQALEWRNQTLTDTEILHAQQAAETHQEWLESEVAYREASERGHMQKHAAKYAVRFAQIWKQAGKIAKRRYAAIHAQNDAERKQLEDERDLILEILDMLVNLEADRQSSAATTAKQMVRIQSRLRRLPRDDAYGSALESLTSSLTDRTEAAEIRELLEDMLRDVEARQALILKVVFFFWFVIMCLLLGCVCVCVCCGLFKRAEHIHW